MVSHCLTWSTFTIEALAHATCRSRSDASRHTIPMLLIVNVPLEPIQTLTAKWMLPRLVLKGAQALPPTSALNTNRNYHRL